MILHHLNSLARSDPNSPVLIEADCVWTAAQIIQHAEACAEQLSARRGEMIAIATTNAVDLLTALSAVETIGGAPAILPAAKCQRDMKGHVESLRLSAIITESSTTDDPGLHVEMLSPGSRSPADPETLTLYTSGTSGPPKPVVHTWSSLTAAIKRSESLQRRSWLLAYQPQTFAGLQVICQALLTEGTLVASASSPGATAPTPEQIAKLLVDHRVDIASATPTFWRWLLNGVSPAQLERSALRQVTLGGEIADQQLLDRLGETFPGARIRHIYASTEMGVCFSVRDGRAGFPASWLEDPTMPCGLRVDGSGELLIQSPRRMRRYADGSSGVADWFPTGDLVEIIGDRVMFTGRRSQTIHVGGQKVAPSRVEAVIREVPGVLEVRVFGVESSLTGQLAQAEIKLDNGRDEATMRRRIQDACRQRLPKHMTPAIVSFTSNITRPIQELASGV